MAGLDQDKLNQLQDTRAIIEKWQEVELAILDEDVAVLKLYRAPVSALSSGACESATDSSAALITSLSIPVV